jgi:hypothetical protein
LIGNHHLGTGPAREVHVLKGVNMAWRRSALAFPIGLAGEGAQPHNEIAMSAWARRRGFRLIYDPSIRVEHFPGQRYDSDSRTGRAAGAVRNEAFNLSLTTIACDHTSRIGVTARGVLVGQASTPGLFRWLAGRFGLASRVSGLFPSLAGRARAAIAPALAFRPVGEES